MAQKAANKTATQTAPSKPQTVTKKMRRDMQKQEREFVRYLIENQARNKPDTRRWVAFTRQDGEFGPALILHVFDLDINPESNIARTSVTGGLGMLLAQRLGSTIDFSTMNNADADSWIETGNLPKGFYG